MQFISSLAAALVAATITRCSAATKSDIHGMHEVHERREGPSWVKIAEVKGDLMLPMRIGLTQNNLDRGEELLMEVSDPTSPKYGQHYTEKQIVDLFAPAEGTFNTVRDWLVSSGIEASRISRSSNKQWVQLDVSVGEMEDLVHATYHVYENTVNGHRGIGTDEYSIPKDIRPSVDYVVPGIKVRHLNSRGDPKQPKPASVKRQSLDSTSISEESAGGFYNGKCDVNVTAACIREVYNLPLNDRAAPGNAMGLWESFDDMWNQQILDEFFTTYQPRIPNGTHPIEKDIDGGQGETKNPQHAGSETLLDMMVAYPLIYPQKIVNFNTNDMWYQKQFTLTYGLWNTFLDALDGSYCNFTAFGETGDDPTVDPVYPNPHSHGYNHTEMCGIYEPTNVISISAVMREQDLPVAYQRRQCAEWMKMGLRGVSVVEASGDNGVADYGNQCLANDVFAPFSACNCPWVTCVGATEYIKSTGQERVVTSYASGAGFSNIFPTPKYQADAVKHYLDTADLPFKSYATMFNRSIGADGGVFNRAGRAYPDVAAFGDDIPIWASGTSASTPLFGSVLTLINEERLAAGKSTVGFVNPALYRNSHVMKDITVGNTPGCKTKGFHATEGWDAASGLGTPKFDAILDMFMCLP